ncbi:ABC transporter substrate-binding protein [soil metagenome]
MRRSISMALLALLMVIGPVASAQDDSQGDTITLRVGLTQPWTTLNVTAGFTVSEFEIWTLQYEGLTNRAADDFEIVPGLAESWEASDDGLTYTYTLREDLVWSDGEPLTADDLAWTINTSRDQGWSNHIATTQNLDAVAVDDRTLQVTSSVPDPKLPEVGVYMLPRHIWEEHATDGEAIVGYEALDGVGSGPFVLAEYAQEQFVRMVANDNYWDGRATIDEIVFRIFTNPDAMVAALQQGQIDAAHNVPSSSVETLEADDTIELVAGLQGGFDEIALNGGEAEGQPHPALLDIEVRKAISHAIDKEAIIEDIWAGQGEAAVTISVSADPKWMPEIPESEQFTYDPDRANQILDDAGYLDTDGDGVREMPGGGDPLVLRHGVNSDSITAQPVAELYAGWLEAIGIEVELSAYDEGQLFDLIVNGDYDSFVWGWVPFVDPDPMLSYFTEEELGNWNDANWIDPRYDELYLEQNQELDEDRRVEIVHEMLRIFHDSAVYIPIAYSPDIQAYRVDRFEGWIQQPADIGPVMFSMSSPSYHALTPVGDGFAGDTSNLLMILGGGALVVAAGLAIILSRRKKTADERD